MKAVISSSCLFIGLFKLIQGRTYAPEIWYYLKTVNAFTTTAIGGTIIMFQYPAALMICVIDFVLLFLYPVVPLTQAHDFSWT